LTVTGELTLERFDLGPEDERVGLEHSIEGRAEIVGQRLVLSAQIRERNVGGHNLVIPHTRTRYSWPGTPHLNCSQTPPNSTNV
jgi:hypothetical protein